MKDTNSKTGNKHISKGWIPEEWEVKEFGNMVNLLKGKYVPKESEHLKCIELEHLEQITVK